MRSLSLNFDRDGVIWTVAGGDVPDLPISGWPSHIVRDLAMFPQWAALGDAWADDLIVEQEKGRYLLPYNQCFAVDDEIRPALGLPMAQPVHISLISRGSAAQEQFSITANVRDREQKSLAGAEYVGPFFIRNQTEAVGLSKSVSALIALVEHPPREAGGPTDRLLYVAQVKKCAEAVEHDAGLASTVSFDSYLDGQDISVAGAIGCDPTASSPERISLRPTVEGINATVTHIPGQVVSGDRSRAKSFVNRQAGETGRKYIVLRPEDRETANEIQTREIVGSNVPKFVLNPEAFLPDSVDLKHYSDRVKSIGIQVYNSRPYIHVRKNNDTGSLEGALTFKTENLVGGAEAGTTLPHVAPTMSSEMYKQLASKSDGGWARDKDRWIQTEENGSDFIDDLGKAGFDTTRTGYQQIRGVLNIFTNLDNEDKYLEYLDADDDLRLEVVPGATKEPISQRFTGTLFPYQTEAYRWLSDLYKTRRGGLLADEMGLGKTVQVLAHVARVLETQPDHPILIVIPLTLMENWTREIRSFLSPPPRIHRHEGPKHHRLSGLKSNPEIVLVSYDTLRRDQLDMARIDWSVVICDEAQFVKNPTAQRTSVVKALKANQRIALTGTPVENGLIEFWCILDYVAPGLLGTWSEFRTEFERPIVEPSSDSMRNELIGKLINKCSVHYRRRLKKDVRDDLTELGEPHREDVALSPKQLNAYQNILREAKKNGSGGILGALQRLLQCCAVPPNMSASLDEQLEACPKLTKTLDILKRIRERAEKVLIFTRFRLVQSVLQNAIVETFGVFPECINGSVHGNRQAVVDHFSEKEGFAVLILSPDVAGIGLNVTAANHVIHYTRPWNPAKEEQATSRAHRIGQEKTVEVYLPITKDERFVTIEQMLDELLQEKQKLARDVLFPFLGLEITNKELLDRVKDSDVPTED